SESLFALELLVEAVRVEIAAAAPGPALLPVVVLRPPSFPALVLRPPEPPPPLCPDRFCHWGRGKRCLELEREPGEQVSCGRRGRFPLRDAEGRSIGDLMLGYRLCVLQATEEPSASTAGPPAAMPSFTNPEPVCHEEEKEEEELEANVFCPPMLYYSREAAKPPLPPAAAVRGGWEHIKVQGPQEKDRGQTPSCSSAEPSLLHPARSNQLHNALGQLPLLSALLAELSVLAQSTVPAADHPYLAGFYQPPGSSGMAAPSPSCFSTLKPAEPPVEPSGSNGAASSQFKQGQKEATSPTTSQTGRGPKKSVLRGEMDSERNCKTKENRHPRKKLLYGLTNSLRLRLQQTNPDKLIIHERREQYRKKQIEVLKKRSPLSKRKLLRNAGEHNVVSCRHCSKEDSSKQKDQPGKTVETSLQNSAPTEYISVADMSLDLQEESIASLMKNDEVAIEECPWKVTSAPLVKKIIVNYAQKENVAKTQLPTAFPSDDNARGSNEKSTQLIRCKTMEHDDASVVSDDGLNSSRSVGNNSKFIYSEDFVASPENTVYSEDFTSAECTDRDLEAPNSSPQLVWHESPKRGTSDTESSKSRISKTSQRAESTSDLQPVPSASSPRHSLKRNNDLKSSKRTSGKCVDSLTLTQTETQSLDEKQEAQHIKEENWGDQHIKQVSTLTSKQACSGTDLDIGKGQNSAGKSQAVTQLSSHLSSNASDFELGVLEDSMSDKEDSCLENPCVSYHYKDISELVISKLPGYTM
ncbi:MAP10 protein, partial [Upupa epops]|nr:MAP10 protein [Upupa epops]